MKMRFKLITPFTLILLFAFTLCFAQVKQIAINRVDAMSNLPRPLQIIDWKQMALNFDRTVYDFKAKGEYWPMVWMDSTGKNFKQPALGMYTAVGDVRQGLQNNKGMFHEALANMGAVLGASLVGLDKSKQQGLNYVGMLKNYFNKDTGWDIMMNNTAPEVALLGGGYGRDWWYDVYPNVLFYAIYDKYPLEPGFEVMARRIAEQFYQADSVLNGNYHYSYFDYGKMKPMTNQICAQPDAAAGHAYVLYAAYKKFGDPRYLKGAVSAMKALESQGINPTYELLMPFGAYLAARMNAEQGTSFNLAKMLDWTFDGTAVCRKGWGFLVGNWNGFDISGTVGSTVDHGGYAFLMNTFDAAWPLVPLVRYKPEYATAIGKWMLNAVNASRLFYPQYMPVSHQTIPELAAVTKGVIAYEGFAKASTFDTLYQSLKAPVAQGDGPKWVPGKNPEVSQFSVYGSAHAGIFGGIVKETDVKGILGLDLLATDFYAAKAYPSYLFYNPYRSAKTINFKLPKGLKGKRDVYDLLSQRFVARNLLAGAKVTIPALQSVVLVCVPAGLKMQIKDKQMWIDGVVVDYNYNKI
ncbi:hypothetical protein [Pedobacter heparinus]|uniref:D-glucuronyl C5-epimerase C-terminal domain-containing protein n=1 Tax=Pedobacter heparinus (strain ATCC 13125 / DSM 2366 / CIP 104194 / JCM 7457 / NBRC 12017 / NCIMB 9290 / NRRL B-14731 / HIM 762-3) TaxID=485917 RepID=C6XVW8_PEDHD|nr:hypothetical protein [Pedobacter heparinus]ACU06193.1 hypothetical protein Phep_4002 [Pedobacter heparinus DSM 2366]